MEPSLCVIKERRVFRVRPRRVWDHLGNQPPRGDSDLKVAVDKKVGLKVVVVLSKRVDELLCYLSTEKEAAGTWRIFSYLTAPFRAPGPTHLKPASIEEELQ